MKPGSDTHARETLPTADSPTTNDPSQSTGSRDELRPRPRMLRTVQILGTGTGIPDRVLDNHELEQLVDTSDEWIMTRTGVRERRIAAPGQNCSDLAADACRAALEQAQLDASHIDLIILATVTPDTPCPSAVGLVQQKNRGDPRGGLRPQLRLQRLPVRPPHRRAPRRERRLPQRSRRRL